MIHMLASDYRRENIFELPLNQNHSGIWFTRCDVVGIWSSTYNSSSSSPSRFILYSKICTLFLGRQIGAS
jgi:hypothetical protein